MNQSSSRMISLDEQFRMHPSICELSSKLFYNNRLQPSEQLLYELNEKLQLPNFKNARIDPKNAFWINKAINPASHPIVFVNSSIVKTHDIPFSQKSTSCINIYETSAIMDLLTSLISSGLDPKDIGILSPYSDQVNFIEFVAKQRFPDVEVHTIDRFQVHLVKNRVVINYV